MLRPLLPDPEQFRAAHSSWIEKTARLMADSAEGTSFGIFGPWGSGKTSAVKALQHDVLHAARAPLQDQNTLAVAYVDCSGLQSSSLMDVRNSVHAELRRARVTRRSGTLEKGIFTFFHTLLGVAKIATTDPISKAGIVLAAGLAKSGEQIAEEKRLAEAEETAKQIEKAFIFLDDLDRCDADAAWAILRHARRALPKTKTVIAIVCDPVVLGHHISHVLGVPLASGFQAVLKYIDIPLRVPTGLTKANMKNIKSRLEPKVSEDWLLAEVAYEAIGSIPMRDVLAALPQACVWLESWDEKLRPRAEEKMKSITEVVFFCSLMYICMPNAGQIIASGKRDWLEFSSSIRTISHGLTNPMKDSTQSSIEKQFGGAVQKVVESRMDLIRYGRSRDIGESLTSLKSSAGDDLWIVLWDMLRS